MISIVEKNDLELSGEHEVLIWRGVLVHFVYYHVWILDWFRNEVRTYFFFVVSLGRYLWRDWK